MAEDKHLTSLSDTKINNHELGVVAHSCNPRALENHKFEPSLVNFSETQSQNKKQKGGGM